MNIGEILLKVWGIRKRVAAFCPGWILMLLCKSESSSDYWWPILNTMVLLVYFQNMPPSIQPYLLILGTYLKRSVLSACLFFIFIRMRGSPCQSDFTFHICLKRAQCLFSLRLFSKIESPLLLGNDLDYLCANLFAPHMKQKRVC